MRHQDLRSLLVLDQNIMRGGDLVSVEAVQQGDADHSRCEEDKKVETVILHAVLVFFDMVLKVMSNHMLVKRTHFSFDSY